MKMEVLSPLKVYPFSLSRMMDGWIVCDFTSFSAVFQSYQDYERSIMKGCVQWNPIYSSEDLALSGTGTWDHQISRPVLNLRLLSHVNVHKLMYQDTLTNCQ